MISKTAQDFCSENLNNIENYEKAIDSNEMWVLHHRLETDLKKTQKQLRDERLFYNRPANELIFLTRSEHMKLHATQFNQNIGRPNKYKGKTYNKRKDQNKMSAFWLFYDYVIKKMKIKEIAEQYNSNEQATWYWMHKFGITKKLQKSFGQNL